MKSKEDKEHTELDGFWRDLRAQMIPDEIPIAESERRMAAAAADPLSEQRIREIVAQATRSPAVATPAPAGMTLAGRIAAWPILSRVAAAGLLVLLLSAGVAVLLWPDSRYSNPRPGAGAGMGFATATMIVTDAADTAARRRVALLFVHMRLKKGIRVLEGLVASDPVCAAAAERILDRVRQAFEDPAAVAGHPASVASFEDVCERAGDPRRSRGERLEALRVLDREMLAGLSSLLQAAVDDDPSLRAGLDAKLRSLRAAVAR